jgi:hypothetical protein
MKRRTLLLLLLLASFASALFAQSIWKEPKNPNWKSATGAEQYERLMWQAVQTKDWLAVESHLASNFVFLDSAGTKDKAQRLADLKQMSATDQAIKDVNVTASGIDAIVTYTLGPDRYMSLWQQQKSGWVMVAMSVTPAR